MRARPFSSYAASPCDFVIASSLFAVNAVTSSPKLTPADENLNIYILPMGEGDSTIVQCPTGKLTIINLGTIYSKSYWNENDVERYIGDIKRVETVIITRPNPSRYNLLPILFEDITSLKKVYIACTGSRYKESTQMSQWIEKLTKANKLVQISSQSTGTLACLGEDCTQIKLCSDSSFLDSKILSANLAGCSPNDMELKGDSIFLQLKFYDFSMVMPGDLQDPTIDSSKYLKEIISNFRDREDLQTTVLQAASNGAWGRANKYFFINALQPQYIVVSNAVPRANSSNYFAPRCELLLYLESREKGSLLDLSTVQSFQCVWGDGTLSRPHETNKAIFLTAFDKADYKVRRVLHISSDGERHKVSHVQIP